MGDNRGNEEEGTRVGGGKCVKIRSDLLALEMKEDEHLRKSRERKMCAHLMNLCPLVSCPSLIDKKPTGTKLP